MDTFASALFAKESSHQTTDHALSVPFVGKWSETKHVKHSVTKVKVLAFWLVCQILCPLFGNNIIILFNSSKKYYAVQQGTFTSDFGATMKVFSKAEYVVH
jgi:hypothetical protein